MRWNRTRVVLCGAAALSLLSGWLLPVSSQAVTPPLQCGQASPTVPWQSLPIPAFPGVQNVTTADKVTAYGIDDLAPNRILATNGTTVQASNTAGCTWQRIFNLDATPASPGDPSGISARIQRTLLLSSGRGVLSLQEGSGTASRPRILSSADATGGGYAPTESGLPQQGAPGPLVGARDGRTVFLAIQPTGGSSNGGGPLPVPLPTLLGGGGPASTAGLIYASTDGGQTWSERTTTADAATGGTRDFTALLVDSGSADRLYAIASGKFLRSVDGGRTFADATPQGMGTVLSMANATSGVLLVFGTGGGYLSFDGGSHFTKAVSFSATAVAFRDDFASIAIETGGRVEVSRGRSAAGPQPAPIHDDPGTLLGDRGPQATFHALYAHRLLRYSDPVASGGVVGPATKVVGDVPPTPPRVGQVSPNGLTITLPPGGSRTVNYRLALPDDPTPLNIFYLIDISSTLTEYQDDLKRNIGKISQALAARRISLRVGVGTLGTGPSDGKPPYPDTSTTCDGTSPSSGYHKPTLYHLLRKLGPADGGFYQAVSRIQTETLPCPMIYGDKNNDAEEGQLLSLEQVATGRGVLSPLSTAAAPQYAVPGGQEAGFQPSPFVRNVVVMATDEYFANPTGSPRKPDGSLDFDRVIAELKAQRIQQLGLTIGTGPSEFTGSYHDLARVALGTGAIAPPGGIRCSDTEQIPAGQPIVCTQPDNFSQLLVSVLSGLRDVQTLSVRRTGNLLAITRVTQGSLVAVDVTKAHTLPFSVTYSCAGLPAGSYPTTVDTLLRGFVVGTAAAKVTCLGPSPVLPAVVFVPPPPPRPILRAVPPPPPAPPPAPPQVPPQGQVQSQVNPVSAAALQEEQQLQLAIALNTLEPPQPDTAELAMVSNQRREEHSAFALLGVAMAAASVGGLVRLRARPDPMPVRARG